MKGKAGIALLLIVFVISIVNTNAQIISNFAGGGTTLGDGWIATAAKVSSPYNGSFDAIGNYYFGQALDNPRVRMVDTFGIIHTVAGNGTVGFSGDGGPATSAQFNQINGITVDSMGNIYISDLQNYRIRKVNAITHIIHTIAGNGINGFTGDGGPADSAEISPSDLCVDNIGNLYFIDKSERVRKIDTFGIITTIAGNGVAGFTGDGGLAIAASLDINPAICIDIAGNLLVSCVGRIRKIDLISGIITTIAGTGNVYYNGDEILADSAHFNGAFGICIDAIGNLYIADYYNERIRMIDTAGIIHTVAGNGIAGYSGDGGLADSAEIHYPEGVAINKCGNLYIADEVNNRIRKVAFNPACWPEKVPEPINNKVVIYPNPAYDNINVDNVKTDEKWSLLNIRGIMLQTGTLKQDNNEISIQALPPGIYIFTLTDNEGNRTVKKIVKE